MPIKIAFPPDVSDAQTICALRFAGYEYEKARGLEKPGSFGAGSHALAQPIIETLTLHTDQNENFLAFFGLQRFLFKWGGERLTKYSREHIAFDFLFLHLYRLDPHAEFQSEEHMLQWHRQYSPRAEAIAAVVRNSFRRLGCGKTSA
jgi:hypothetical protein